MLPWSSPKGNPQILLSPKVGHQLIPKLAVGSLSCLTPVCMAVFEIQLEKHGKKVSRSILPWRRCN